ncbi:MAG: hypothetical protein PUD59_01880 [bacterium]|nr:hypothetical protein [bacterium]
MKVYLISGEARNGKDTIGNFLEEEYKKRGLKVCKSQISKYLKVYVKDYFGWNGSEETKPRELLQQLGTDVIREKLNKPRFFVDRTIEDIDILSHFFDVMIITDIRFPIEITAIKEAFDDVVSINVKRINFESELTNSQQLHKTETALNNFSEYDYKIVNDTLEKLQQDCIEIINKESKKLNICDNN